MMGWLYDIIMLNGFFAVQMIYKDKFVYYYKSGHEYVITENDSLIR